MSDLVTAGDFEAARERIRGRVRRTPVMRIAPMKAPIADGADLILKLENLQVTGSFKPRGAINKLLSLEKAAIDAGIITASGGNHGLAVAYAGWVAKTRATVYLPASTPDAKADAIRSWGAEVIVEGAVWDDANEAALAAARERGMTYIHPFADPAVIAGQGTLGLEILDQVSNADTLVVAIGGGGLISGVAAAAKAAKPGIKIVGVEPTGAPTLYRSLKEGGLATLESIETRAGTLAPRRSMPINYEMIAAAIDRIVLVSDEEMADAARWLWAEAGIAAELSGAASVAALMAGRHQPDMHETVVPIVCGSGTDGIAS